MQSCNPDTPGGSKNAFGSVGISQKSGASFPKRLIKPGWGGWEPGMMVPRDPIYLDVSHVEQMLDFHSTLVKQAWPTDTRAKTHPKYTRPTEVYWGPVCYDWSQMAGTGLALKAQYLYLYYMMVCHFRLLAIGVQTLVSHFIYLWHIIIINYLRDLHINVWCC